MDFGDQYLTYREYIKMGGKINRAPFNILEFEARKKIDLRTQYRLKDVDDIPDEVLICMFKLINKMSEYDERLTKINKRDVASENIDGYSVSYINSSQTKEIIDNKNIELNDIIEEELYGVIANGETLLYLGVKTC